MNLITRFKEPHFLRVMFRVVARILQFLIAVAVVSLCAVVLDQQPKHEKQLFALCIFGEAIAGLSALTCVVYAIPGVKWYLCPYWDLVLW